MELDVRAVLEEQRRRQLRFHLKQAAWIVWVPVVGFALSSMGLMAARALSRDGVGLSTTKLAFLWFGFVTFGVGLVSLLTAPLRLRPRIVPYFARQIEEYGRQSSRAFGRGGSLYREILAMEELAETLGVKPLSTFGFADDYYGQTVHWHAASQGGRQWKPCGGVSTRACPRRSIRPKTSRLSPRHCGLPRTRASTSAWR